MTATTRPMKICAFGAGAIDDYVASEAMAYEANWAPDDSGNGDGLTTMGAQKQRGGLRSTQRTCGRVARS